MNIQTKLHWQKIRAQIDTVPFFPEIIALLAAAVSIYIWFPGMMSYDSFVQYKEALGMRPVSDAHSALMSYVWRGLLIFGESPGVMMFLHQLLYWLACYLFSLYFFTRKSSRILFILLFGFWPPMFIISLHLWKDVGMMAGFALSLIFTLFFRKSGSWPLAVLAFIFLFYANAMRLNAVLGAIPIAILLAEALFQRGTGLSRWLKIGVTALLIIVLQVGVISRINRNVNHVSALGTIFVWDIAAISIQENQNLYPPYLERLVPEDKLLASTKANYNVEANFYLWDTISPYPPKGFERQLNKDFVKLVVEYPIAYLKHRLRVFALQIGISRETCFAHNGGIDQNDLGIAMVNLDKVEQKKVFAFFDWIGNSIIYRAWLYILIGIYIVFRAISEIRKSTAKTLKSSSFASLVFVLSGWLIVFPLFFFGPAADFRYGIWLIYSTVIAVVLIKTDKSQFGNH